MAEKMQWNETGSPPPGVIPQQKRTWKKRDLIIAIVLFLVLAPLLLVSLGALAANIMGLASMMDPVANQGATVSGMLGMLFLMVTTTAYPFVYAISLVATFVQKKLDWKTWLVCIAALPMIGILLWLLAGSLPFFGA